MGLQIWSSSDPFLSEDRNPANLKPPPPPKKKKKKKKARCCVLQDLGLHGVPPRVWLWRGVVRGLGLLSVPPLPPPPAVVWCGWRFGALGVSKSSSSSSSSSPSSSSSSLVSCSFLGHRKRQDPDRDSAYLDLGVWGDTQGGGGVVGELRTGIRKNNGIFWV